MLCTGNEPVPGRPQSASWALACPAVVLGVVVGVDHKSFLIREKNNPPMRGRFEVIQKCGAPADALRAVVLGQEGNFDLT